MDACRGFVRVQRMYRTFLHFSNKKKTFLHVPVTVIQIIVEDRREDAILKESHIVLHQYNQWSVTSRCTDKLGKRAWSLSSWTADHRYGRWHTGVGNIVENRPTASQWTDRLGKMASSLSSWIADHLRCFSGVDLLWVAPWWTSTSRKRAYSPSW
jgi:hypothetical protein